MLIKLKRDGYDEYLDYLKGMSIIMVLINHGAQNIVDMALFPIWIYEAVPMFLLIQVFHAYKRRTVQNPSINKDMGANSKALCLYSNSFYCLLLLCFY